MYLITGDVEGLYVNIPINVALEVIGGFLAQSLARGGSGACAACQASRLRRARHLVFHTMFLRFGTRYYKQVYGFPMGSPPSPDAANLFMALIEDVFGEWQHAPQPLHNYLPLPECLKLIKRLINDYTVVLAGVSRLQVNTILNELDRRLDLVGLKVTWVVHTQFCDALDLHVYKPEEMRLTGKLAFRTHQKVGHRYQYLARSSMHNPQVFQLRHSTKRMTSDGCRTGHIPRICTNHDITPPPPPPPQKPRVLPRALLGLAGPCGIPCQCRELLPHCDPSVRALHLRHAHHKRINVPS